MYECDVRLRQFCNCKSRSSFVTASHGVDVQDTTSNKNILIKVSKFTIRPLLNSSAVQKQLIAN